MDPKRWCGNPAASAANEQAQRLTFWTLSGLFESPQEMHEELVRKSMGNSSGSFGNLNWLGLHGELMGNAWGASGEFV